MQADDPTDPAEIGKAAKPFFSDGSSDNCRGVSTPKCSPICTVNDHVLRWLLQPERQRYTVHCFHGNSFVLEIIYYNFMPLDKISKHYQLIILN